MSERHEGVVRMDSSLQAIVCEMYALQAHVEGMKAENAQAIMENRDLPHNGAAFGFACNEFEKLAKRFMTRSLSRWW